MENTKRKAYAVLFQYSPNGRNDKGEFSASMADGRMFRSKESACRYIKGKYDELLEQERVKGCELDPEWAAKITDEEAKAMGYSHAPDFSWLSFEYESQCEDVPPEPKYSWTAVELEEKVEENA